MRSNTRVEKNVVICFVLSPKAITGPSSNSMQYVEVEISGVVTLPMLPATSVKKAPRRMENLKASKIGAKLNLNLNRL